MPCLRSHFGREFFQDQRTREEWKLTDHSEAEITIGIICSCLPALPALVRHYGPKITSKLMSSQASKSRAGSSQLKKGLIFPGRGTHTNYHRRDPKDPRLPDGKYLELSEMNSQNGISDMGLSTKIEGGIRRPKQGHDGLVGEGLDDELRTVDHAVLRTVCIESYPQPAPKVSGPRDTTREP